MHIRTILLSVVCLCFISLGLDSAPVPADGVKQEGKGKEWPLFRGDALQTGVAQTTLPKKLELLWSFQTQDTIEGAPVIVDGVVYVGSMNEVLYAFDLATGQKKWEYKGGPFKAAPAWKDNKLFIGDVFGMFHCVDAKTGKKIWTFETGAEITSGANFSDNHVLFGSHDETLYCLDITGKAKWQVKTDGPVNGSPAVVGGRTFLAGCDSSVHIVDIATGKELGTVDLGGQAAASAAVHGEELYVGTMTNQFHAVNWKKPAIAWSFMAPRRAQPFYGSAAVTDSVVVVGSRDRNIWAIDRKTGKARWSYATNDRVDSSPIIVGEYAYAGSLDGKLYVIELATGKLVESLTLDSGVSGSPSAAEGRLLVGTQDGTLYCYGAKK